MSEAPKVAPLTMDEITNLISDLARNGEGPDRFRALKLLSSMNSATAGLPDPMADADLIDRLGRLMKGAGTEMTHLAYNRAFPQRGKRYKGQIGSATIHEADMDIDRSKLPRTLKSLYRMFPEVKRSGFPPGYPVGKGIAIQQEYCMRMAVKIMRDREQALADQGARERAEQDATMRAEDAAEGL